MSKVILWIWQLPQNIIALFMIFIYPRMNKTWKVIDKDRYYYYLTGKYNFGVCLGEYILIGRVDMYKEMRSCYTSTLKHESGHRIQSRMLGPLYLFIVGIPSVTLNLINRFRHRNWTYKDKIEWYYNKFPENWADNLGGTSNVDRL